MVVEYTVETVYGVALFPAATLTVLLRTPVSVAVTGQTVVYRLIISVVTFPILAGQSVTDAAQEVMVYTWVLYTVDVVS